MAITNVESIEILDKSSDGKIRFELYVDGCRRAHLTMRGSVPQLHWDVSGAQDWPEAKNLLSGLLQLSVIADSLEG